MRQKTVLNYCFFTQGNNRQQQLDHLSTKVSPKGYVTDLRQPRGLVLHLVVKTPFLVFRERLSLK